MKKSIKELEDEIQRLNREFLILSEISQSVNQSTDLHEILNNSLNKVTELIGIRSAGIYLLDEKGETKFFQKIYGRNEEIEIRGRYHRKSDPYE